MTKRIADILIPNEGKASLSVEPRVAFRFREIASREGRGKKISEVLSDMMNEYEASLKAKALRPAVSESAGWADDRLDSLVRILGRRKKE